MQKTTNYNLNQWEAGDRVTRADFNADNAAVDAALKAVADAASAGGLKLVTGTYTGDGAASQTIALGIAPKAAYVCAHNGAAFAYTNAPNFMGGLALPGHPVRNGSTPVAEISGESLIVYLSHTNTAGTEYYYIAVG